MQSTPRVPNMTAEKKKAVQCLPFSDGGNQVKVARKAWSYHAKYAIPGHTKLCARMRRCNVAGNAWSHHDKNEVIQVRGEGGNYHDKYELVQSHTSNTSCTAPASLAAAHGSCTAPASPAAARGSSQHRPLAPPHQWSPAPWATSPRLHASAGLVAAASRCRLPGLASALSLMPVRGMHSRA
eukprot:scaffold67150_cov16-Tisochrysis_lutea.AAC.1